MRSNAALLIVRVAKVFVSSFSVKWKIGALIHFQGWNFLASLERFPRVQSLKLTRKPAACAHFRGVKSDFGNYFVRIFVQ
jgi:hypothetical protein